MSKNSSLLIRDAATDAIREATAGEILAAAREQLSRRVRRGATLASPRATRDYLALRLGTLEYEVFCLDRLLRGGAADGFARAWLKSRGLDWAAELAAGFSISKEQLT